MWGRLQPARDVGPLALVLAQTIAEDRWRLHRARVLENSIFALGHREQFRPDAILPEVDAALAQGRTWIAQAKNLQLLSRYEQRIRRCVESSQRYSEIPQNPRATEESLAGRVREGLRR